jgi:hypothetical protein
MLQSRIAIREDPDGVGLDEQPSALIYVKPSRCDQEVNLISCRERGNFPEKFRQGNAR